MIDSVKTLTSFRISAHNLDIERGTYQNIHRERRLCKLQFEASGIGISLSIDMSLLYCIKTILVAHYDRQYQNLLIYMYYWHKVKHIYPTKLKGTAARNYV